MKTNYWYLNIIEIIFIIILTPNLIFAQENLLSEKEKLEDFNKMYEVLKENYINFEVNRRVNGIDWPGNYEKYKNAVLETHTDIEFYEVIKDIIGDLNHGHAYVLPFNRYKYFVDIYTQIAENNPFFEAWLEELTNENVKSNIDHWLEITQNNNDLSNDKNEKQNSDTVVSSNIYFKTTPDEKTAVLSIKSFHFELIQKDHDSLLTIFSSLPEYDNFVIDIQGNPGGADTYWIYYLVPFISEKTHLWEFYLAFRNSSLVKYFYFDLFDATSTAPDLPNLPPELIEWDVLFDKISMTITPNAESINYSGNIYLLVDQEVSSAAESFAIFSKHTGFATVAGTKTAGHGLGRNPILFSLPNSGLIINFQAFMGLNPDGSPNEETKTIPDIILSGKTQEERLEELIKLLEEV